VIDKIKKTKKVARILFPMEEGPSAVGRGGEGGCEATCIRVLQKIVVHEKRWRLSSRMLTAPP